MGFNSAFKGLIKLLFLHLVGWLYYSKYLFRLVNVVCDNFNAFCRQERALAIKHGVSQLYMIHIPIINRVNTV